MVISALAVAAQREARRIDEKLCLKITRHNRGKASEAAAMTLLPVEPAVASLAT